VILNEKDLKLVDNAFEAGIILYHASSIKGGNAKTVPKFWLASVKNLKIEINLK